MIIRIVVASVLAFFNPIIGVAAVSALFIPAGIALNHIVKLENKLEDAVLTQMLVDYKLINDKNEEEVEDQKKKEAEDQEKKKCKKIIKKIVSSVKKAKHEQSMVQTYEVCNDLIRIIHDEVLDISEIDIRSSSMTKPKGGNSPRPDSDMTSKLQKEDKLQKTV